MDGATNVNPSNAPHVLTSREEKKVVRSIAREATVDEKHVAQVGKALKSAEKDEGRAEKAMQKAQQAHEKAVKQEHKTAQVLINAQHKHDLAKADENKAAKDLSMSQKYLQEAHRTVESRRTEVEQFQRKKDSGDVARAERLRQTQRGTASGAAQGESNNT